MANYKLPLTVEQLIKLVRYYMKIGDKVNYDKYLTELWKETKKQSEEIKNKYGDKNVPEPHKCTIIEFKPDYSKKK